VSAELVPSRVEEGSLIEEVEEWTTGSKPPTQEGLLAHLMRHNNEQARLNTSAMGAMIAHLVRMVKSQGAQIDGLLRDEISTVQDMFLLERARMR
jgi:hypothetical protein